MRPRLLRADGTDVLPEPDWWIGDYDFPPLPAPVDDEPCRVAA